MDLSKINEINRKVKSRFTYTPDKPAEGHADDWQSHWRKLIQDKGYEIHDDCDGLASTVAEGIMNAGGRAYRLLVGSAVVRAIDHMVALVACSNGHYYIVGDTQNDRPVKLSDYDKKIYYIHDPREGIVWKKWKLQKQNFGE